MPNPVIESITPTTNIAPADATLDVTLDNADSADDLLLMFLSCHVGVLSTPPTGWTELADMDGGNFSLGVFYKKATGSEGATAVPTVAATPSAFAAQVYRISNWDITEPPVARTIQNLGTTAAPDPSSFTGWGWGAADNLFINAIGFADDAETVTGWPSNFTDGTLDTTADNGLDESAQCASSYLFDNASTTVDCGAYTLSGAEGVISTTIAILGGAGGPAPDPEQLSMGGVIVTP
jgi:hypothetical protein